MANVSYFSRRTSTPTTVGVSGYYIQVDLKVIKIVFFLVSKLLISVFYVKMLHEKKYDKSIGG